jgi:hypothetical protein
MTAPLGPRVGRRATSLQDTCYSAPMIEETMQPPTSADVIERYGIEVLKLNHVAFYAIHRLVDGWRYNAPTLRFLFDHVFAVRHRHNELAATLLSGKIPSSRLSGSNRPGVFESPGAEFHFELLDATAAHALGANAYAWAVVLVLSRLLQAFKDDLDASRDEWDSSEPLIHGCSIGAILTASANNFRHSDEWLKDRGCPTPQQLQSIRVLAAAFREPDGANHQLGRDVCQETLQLLSDGSFDTLSEKFFAFANSMVKRRIRT